VANGPTLAKVLCGVTRLSADLDSLQPTLSLLHELHSSVLGAFVHEGLIHSDVHLGNIVQEEMEDGSLALALFDVGQFEHVGPADVKALLWTLSWISGPSRYDQLRGIALHHLSAVSSLKAPEEGMDRAQTKLQLATAISNAFDEATSPFEDGSLPDKKTAYMLFLRNAERDGVVLPRGAFAVAKMVDSVFSQQDSFGLPDVVDDTIEKFLVRSLTWEEIRLIGIVPCIMTYMGWT